MQVEGLYVPEPSGEAPGQRRGSGRARARASPTRRRRVSPAVYQRWNDDDEERAEDAADKGCVSARSHRHAHGTNANAIGGDADPRPAAPIVTLPTAPKRRGSPTGAVNGGGTAQLSSAEAILVASQLLHRLDQLEVQLTQSDEAASTTHLRQGFRDACVDLLQRFPPLARSKNVDERLWLSYKREFAALERQLSIDTAGAGGYASQIRDALRSALSMYHALIERVTALVPTTHSEQQSTIGFLLHRLNLAYAHVMYSLEEQNPIGQRNWYISEIYYEAARRWMPHEGESHYHLARVMLLDGRRAEALYHFLRNRLSEVQYGSPVVLADLFLAIRSPFDAGRGAAAAMGSHDPSVAIDSVCWEAMDRTVLRVVVAFLSQEPVVNESEDIATVTSSLCQLVDSLLGDATPSFANRTTRKMLQLVRVVGLLVGCATLAYVSAVSNDQGGEDSSEPRPHDTRPTLELAKWRHAVHLVLSLTNCLLHRALAAITSPVRSADQKREALELILPPVTVALTWYRKQPWQDMADPRMADTCGHLCVLLRRSVLHDEAALGGTISAPSAQSVILLEDIELAGFQPLDHRPQRSTNAHLPLQVEAEQVSSDQQARLRLARFLSLVEAMQPSASVPDGSALTIASNKDGRLASKTRSSNRVRRHDQDQEEEEDDDDDDDDGSFSEPKGIIQLVRRDDTPSSTVSSATTAAVSALDEQRVVVLDAANIAMRHGRQRHFSSRGVQLCAEYFLARGDRVVAFLPDYCLDRDAMASNGNAPMRRSSSRRRRERPTTSPDDPALLQAMVDTGLVVLTPAHDSDDVYCISYARRHDAFVVTNDLFRDHISDTDGPRARQTELRTWLAAHRISYTWVADEFLPNPNSAYDRRSS